MRVPLALPVYCMTLQPISEKRKVDERKFRGENVGQKSVVFLGKNDILGQSIFTLLSPRHVSRSLETPFRSTNLERIVNHRLRSGR